MIGLDIQQVEKIKDAEKLLNKIGLPNEIEYVKKFKKQFKQEVASLWAFKEAVFKALDVCEGEISFQEIELCHKESGAPFVKLYGKAKKCFENKNFSQICISISHQSNIVACVAEIL